MEEEEPDGGINGSPAIGNCKLDCWIPAAQCRLQQGGDADAEKDGPDELTGGPLIKADTHGLCEKERDGDGPAETCQVVLGKKKKKTLVTR